jgi:hypothetical protein
VQEMWQEERQLAWLEQPLQALVEHGKRTIVATESHQTLITSHTKDWPLSRPSGSQPAHLEWGLVTVEAKTVVGGAVRNIYIACACVWVWVGVGVWVCFCRVKTCTHELYR